MKFVLVRTFVGDEGAFGTLALEGKPPFAVTLERTFENNRIVVPVGVSKCTYDFYHKGGYPTYEIQIPKHDRVLFHKGNTEQHSIGCILVAEYFHDFGGFGGIANSAAGFTEFMQKTKKVKEFDLLVIEVK